MFSGKKILIWGILGIFEVLYPFSCKILFPGTNEESFRVKSLPSIRFFTVILKFLRITVGSDGSKSWLNSSKNESTLG
jgi:hypothetical protein